MAFRIEILAQNEEISFKDGRALQIEHILERKGISADVRIVDVYTSENEVINADFFISSVTNPVTQKANAALDGFDWALEIGYLPGVTDNIGHTSAELLGLGGATNDNECFTSRLYLIKGALKRADVEELARTLSNKLIQRNIIKTYDEFKAQGGMEAVVPKVQLDNQSTAADEVDLQVSDAELEKLGKEGIANADGTRRIRSVCHYSI